MESHNIGNEGHEEKPHYFAQESPIKDIIPNIDQGVLAAAHDRGRSFEEGIKYADFGCSQSTRYAFFDLSDVMSVWRDIKNGGLSEIFEDVEDFIDVFKDKVVVEIGPGAYSYYNTTGYFVANMLGAKGYVAVEPFWSDEVRSALLKREVQASSGRASAEHTKRLKELNQSVDIAHNCIPWSVQSHDILLFLKSLPNKSVSIIAGGIDHCIIQDPERLKEIAKEVERVVCDGGGFWSIASDIYPNFPDGRQFSDDLDTFYVR